MIVSYEFVGWWCQRRVPFNTGEPTFRYVQATRRADTVHTDPVEGCPGPHVPIYTKEESGDG